MLYTETVERKTIELLKKIMNDPELDEFHLAGGTALALYLGHRKSIDFDLFCSNDFPSSELAVYLIDNFNFKEDFRDKNTLKGTIENVKIDCIAHKYEVIRPIEVVDGIRLYSWEDISAMKLNAIADNGTRLKDFVDIACLSAKMSLNEMLESYQKKYPNSNAVRALRGLTYYDDIIHEPINLIKGKYTWPKVRKRIEMMIKKDTQKFDSLPF